MEQRHSAHRIYTHFWYNYPIIATPLLFSHTLRILHGPNQFTVMALTDSVCPPVRQILNHLLQISPEDEETRFTGHYAGSYYLMWSLVVVSMAVSQSCSVGDLVLSLCSVAEYSRCRVPIPAADSYPQVMAQSVMVPAHYVCHCFPCILSVSSL